MREPNASRGEDVDETVAAALLAEARDARQAMRRQEGATAMERFERRYADIRGAMDWCLAHGRVGEADAFASALVPFWMATKRLDDGREWFARALGEGATEEPTRARALYDHGYLVFWAGEYELADQRFSEARRLAEQTGDRDLIALILAGSARVALDRDPARAVALLREAMAITEDLPDSDGRSSADHVLGVALQMAGDLEGAGTVMRERIERARSVGNRFTVASESANLSMVERRLGHLDDAERLSTEALQISRDNRDEIMIPWVINGLAAVTAAQGRLERAATLLGIADGLLERAGGSWPPDEREQYDEALGRVADGVSPETVATARARGAEMLLDEAVGFALAGG